MSDLVTPAPTEPVVEPAKVVEPVVEQEVAEEFDKERAMSTIHKLREFEKNAKKELKELETLKAEKQQRAEAEMTEVQKLQKQAADAKAEADKLKADILRRDVVAETGLPAIFADRLQGATKEEMLEDAKKLKEVLPKATAPHLSASNPNNASPNETDQQKRDRLFGKQSNPFDFEAIKAQGGGVVWNK